MTMIKKQMQLGYSLQDWREFGEKTPIYADISTGVNAHTLLCGMSGSGKSYCVLKMLANFSQTLPDAEFYFSDYKQDKSFAFLSDCKRYFEYDKVFDALNIVHNRMLDRQSGEDTSTNPVILIYDEYVASMINLLNKNKKMAEEMMNKVAEILMLGRSLKIIICLACQRPDAKVFQHGSRLNFGILIVLGAPHKSIYEMLLPDYVDEVKGEVFETGEGVAVLKCSEFKYIKIPTFRDEMKIQAICRQVLSW